MESNFPSEFPTEFILDPEVKSLRGIYALQALGMYRCAYLIDHKPMRTCVYVKSGAMFEWDVQAGKVYEHFQGVTDELPAYYCEIVSMVVQIWEGFRLHVPRMLRFSWKEGLMQAMNCYGASFEIPLPEPTNRREEWASNDSG